MRAVLAIVALLAAAPVAAEPVTAAPLARFVDVESARLPRRGTFAAGFGQRREAWAVAELAFVEHAALGVSLDDRIALGDDRATATSARVPSASFRLGWPGAGARPDLSLGLTRSITGSWRTISDTNVAGDAAELRATASWRWAHPRVGALDLALGASAWDLERPGDGGQPVRLPAARTARLRPWLATAWSPPAFPRTTLIAEVGAAPVVTRREAALEPRLAWAIRYQVWSSLAIDLAVRHRLDAPLEATTVLLRAAVTPR